MISTGCMACQSAGHTVHTSPGALSTIDTPAAGCALEEGQHWLYEGSKGHQRGDKGVGQEQQEGLVVEQPHAVDHLVEGCKQRVRVVDQTSAPGGVSLTVPNPVLLTQMQ